jgi:hypothetical protein
MRDIKDAFRSLAATPLVTAVAVLSLAPGHRGERGDHVRPAVGAGQRVARPGADRRDPLTPLLAALVLSAIGALAGWIPARRAARIDPARVLREG